MTPHPSDDATLLSESKTPAKTLSHATKARHTPAATSEAVVVISPETIPASENAANIISIPATPPDQCTEPEIIDLTEDNDDVVVAVTATSSTSRKRAKPERISMVSAQDLAERKDLQLVSYFPVTIVLLKEYSGVARNGDPMTLVRERQPSHDHLRVDNRLLQTVGYLSKEACNFLLPYLDAFAAFAATIIDDSSSKTSTKVCKISCYLQGRNKEEVLAKHPVLFSKFKEASKKYFATIQSTAGRGNLETTFSVARRPTPESTLTREENKPKVHQRTSFPAVARIPTTAPNEETPKVYERFLASIPAHIVGMVHYAGKVRPGDILTLVREPHNPHDRNAIRIDNPQGQAVGHLPRNYARCLAPLMDSTGIVWKGISIAATSGFLLNCYARATTLAELQIKVKTWLPQLIKRARKKGITISQKNTTSVIGNSSNSTLTRTPTAVPKPSSGPTAAALHMPYTASTISELFKTIDPTTTTAASTNTSLSEGEQKFLTTCMAPIVGMHNYSGVANTGQFVTLVREPSNRSDTNAIRVDNIEQQTVGYLSREQASFWAPLMDAGILIMGTFSKSNPSHFSLTCKLDCYVTGTTLKQAEARAKVLLPFLALKAQIYGIASSFTAPEIRGNATPVAPARLPPAPTTVIQQMDWKAQAHELDQLFDQLTANQLKNLPKVSLPTSLKARLMAHQMSGVQWMIRQETNEQRLPFFKKRANGWYCEITNATQPNPPQGFFGGILADEMGLGKTLQMIALMLVARGMKDVKLAPGTVDCTLIVCPVSVMSNWEQQIQAHVQRGVLKVDTYQGTARARVLADVQRGRVQVLLVNYHTLAAEWNKIYGKHKVTEDPTKKKAKTSSRSIFDLAFHRIVLDEAHMIRSSKTALCQAALQITAKRKWALTGTPFVNRALDLWSLLEFLKVEPLRSKSVYMQAITMPLQGGDEIGLARLRTTMAHVALRRSKATADLPKLVEKTVEMSSVSFAENDTVLVAQDPKHLHHKTIYDALFGTVRIAFQAVLAEDSEGNTVFKNYSHIFERLLRLRQACCSAKLVPKHRRETALRLWKEIKGKQDLGIKLTAEEGLELLEKLNGAFASDGEAENDGSAEAPECAICLMEMEQSQCVILRECGHVYCKGCITQVANATPRPTCPLCRVSFSKSDMVQKSVASVAAQQPKEGGGKLAPMPASIPEEDIGPSPKIRALLAAIATNMKPGEKGVIFSQFTSFLDLIQMSMHEAGHTFTRLDGTMSAKDRLGSISKFSSDDRASPRFILCSLHAAGTGINLTRGNHAFLMDTWWNQAVENQAMDRVHRIGQVRPVRIVRFVMKDSLEERIVDLQEVKNLQAKRTMQKLEAEELRRARLSDLKGLLQID